MNGKSLLKILLSSLVLLLLLSLPSILWAQQPTATRSPEVSQSEDLPPWLEVILLESERNQKINSILPSMMDWFQNRSDEQTKWSTELRSTQAELLRLQVEVIPALEQSPEKLRIELLGMTGQWRESESKLKRITDQRNMLGIAFTATTVTGLAILWIYSGH